MAETELEQTRSAYWQFYDAVAEAQVLAWLPEGRVDLLDLSQAAGRYARLAHDRGHRVIHATDAGPPLLADSSDDLWCVSAATQDLSWLRSASTDAVLAESGTLSSHLAAEHTVEELGRVLRPGGRLLLCVESLMLGLSRLAEQGRWAELSDAPSADVVLIPNEDGSITRCFWPEDLIATLNENGFDVEWVRPRTVLPAEIVERSLRSDPRSLPTLVKTEVSLAREREGETNGIHLVAAARRR